MGFLSVTAGIALSLYVLRKWKEWKWGWCECQGDLSGKVVVITGGNSGIGLETARGLAQRGALVVLACRDASKAHQAIVAIRRTVTNGDLVFLEVDLASVESVKQFVLHLLAKFKRIDVLINNAGVYYPPQDPPVTNDEGLEIHFAVNHLGHFLLTHLLTDTIAATPNSRIVIVSSELYKSGRLDLDNLRHPRYSGGRQQQLYSNSKLANLLHAKELHRRLAGRGVLVVAVSPGFVHTSLFRHSLGYFGLLKRLAFVPVAFLFMRSAAQGAQSSIHCACSRDVTLQSAALAPQYYSNCRVAPVLPLAQDDGAAQALWDRSVELLQLN